MTVLDENKEKESIDMNVQLENAISELKEERRELRLTLLSIVKAAPGSSVVFSQEPYIQAQESYDLITRRLFYAEASLRSWLEYEALDDDEKKGEFSPRNGLDAEEAGD